MFRKDKKSGWTAVAYRSPETNNAWVVYGKPVHMAQTYIMGWIVADKAKHIWLMQRRVGMVGRNHFELVIKDR